MNDRLKNALILTGVLVVADLAQGVVLYSLGKSGGSFSGFLGNLAIPSGKQLFNLVLVAIGTSLIVGSTQDYIKHRLNLDECADLRQSLAELTDAAEASL